MGDSALTVDLLLVSALWREMRVVSGRLGLSRAVRVWPGDEGVVERWGRRSVVRLCSGMGRTRMEACVAGAVERWRPAGVVVFGLAGGLNLRLRAGCGFAAHQVQAEGIDLGLGEDGRIVEPEGMGAWSAGQTLKLWTASRPVCLPAEKAELSALTGADALDMETAYAAEVCRGLKVRFWAFRAISDDAGHRLPQALMGRLSEVGEPSVSSLAGVILRRPWGVATLVRLGWNTGRALKSLASLLAHWERSLPDIIERRSE